MKNFLLGKSDLSVPSLAVGCMRISDLDDYSLDQWMDYCLSHGLNFFDHADIYGRGACEELFGKAFKRGGYKREDVILQSKCSIVPGKMYDCSYEHILSSVDGILNRLQTDYLDILLLHRPDALIEPEEVAEAFDRLQNSGKVRYFGVSNHRPGQIELLKKYVRQDILVNQLQLSIPFSNMIAAGLETNMLTDGAVDRDGGILDYCRLNDITIQTWSPFQYGFFEGPFVGNCEKFKKLNDVLDRLSKKYNATPTAIATAWILRHPASTQVVFGSAKIPRINEILCGSDLVLEREEWYELYLSSGHILP